MAWVGNISEKVEYILQTLILTVFNSKRLPKASMLFVFSTSQEMYALCLNVFSQIRYSSQKTLNGARIYEAYWVLTLLGELAWVTVLLCAL